MTDDELDALQQRRRTFAAERDWEQFHTPKNLAMALAAEVGELISHFQWLTADESRAVATMPEVKDAIEDEIADVAIYLASLADALGIDILQAANDKIDRNVGRFPPQASPSSRRSSTF